MRHQFKIGGPDWRAPERTARALGCAHKSIHRFCEANGLVGRCDATTIAASVSGRSCVITLAGDSRAYVFGADGEYWRTEDDYNEERECVTRMTGYDAGPPREVRTFEANAGDIVLLCTDGLHDVVADAEIRAIASGASDPHKLVATLVELALERGTLDNVTVVAGILEPVPERGVLRQTLERTLFTLRTVPKAVWMFGVVVALSAYWIGSGYTDIVIEIPEDKTYEFDSIAGAGPGGTHRMLVAGLTREASLRILDTDGNLVAVQTWAIVRGQPDTFAWIPPPTPLGSFAVAVDPPEADAWYRHADADSFIAITIGEPIKVEVGSYVIRAAEDGYVEGEKTFVIREGVATPTPITLLPSGSGQLQFFRPSGVRGIREVLIDGAPSGAQLSVQLQDSLGNVSSGWHDVDLVLDSGEVLHKRILLLPGGTKTVSW